MPNEAPEVAQFLQELEHPRFKALAGAPMNWAWNAAFGSLVGCSSFSEP
jgi:hypothetical protein